ncbi:hypothetical protein IMZ31_19425 (plasmid) [Pontibacillus sp. ALD_SL1]|uniref:hypothetical protein n=1 Tax=Pontibacillus sp. ALD_SL1 TaxID=2777185 RepID=UPI001A9684C1|nr:hypothetical protein [Pontibacillus sp. ALD_SL1]QST02722.1 hypothetical protein IMZ31_19425 [Pontibacillus sp. ALD_SL1]
MQKHMKRITMGLASLIPYFLITSMVMMMDEFMPMPYIIGPLLALVTVYGTGFVVERVTAYRKEAEKGGA